MECQFAHIVAITNGTMFKLIFYGMSTELADTFLGTGSVMVGAAVAIAQEEGYPCLCSLLFALQLP